jgi:hypothetical protein
MTVYLEMAKRLRSEIALAQKHLTNLNAALAALEPLITFENDDGMHEVKALSYSNSQEAVEAQFVEEVAVSQTLQAANIEKPVLATRTRKRRTAATSTEELTGEAVPVSSATDITSRFPSTSGKFWLSVMGKRTYSIPDIVERAMQQLEVAEEARPILTNRLSAWHTRRSKQASLSMTPQKGEQSVIGSLRLSSDRQIYKHSTSSD